MKLPGLKSREFHLLELTVVFKVAAKRVAIWLMI